MRIQQERGNYNEDSLFEVSALTEASLGPLCNRVNNAFVERMLITFTRFLDDARFLRHLRDHVAELKCRANFLDVRNSFDSANYDDALVDFVASRLKPQTLICSIQRAQQASQAMLFNHAPMRSVLKHVEVYVSQCRGVRSATHEEVKIGRTAE